MKQSWNKQSIIDSINILLNDGNHSSSYLVKLGHNKLISAALSHFGTWDNVLMACGYQPRNKGNRVKWTKEKIKQFLINRHSQNEPINYHAIATENPSLISASGRLFSSWKDACEYSGVPWSTKCRRWTSNDIIDRIRQLHRMNINISMNKIRNVDSGFHSAAKKRFGSWYRAVSASGIDIETIKPKNVLSKETLIKSIRQRYKRGLPVNSFYIQKMYSQLYTSARRIFGSWDGLLVSAGCHLDESKLTQFWTPDVVIKRIKERESNKQSLYFVDVVSEESSLTVMAKKYFGNWSNALKSSGITSRRKQNPRFGEFILGEILKKLFYDYEFIRGYIDKSWLESDNGACLELDFYCKALKLAFEFQGPQHFCPIYGQEKLESQIISDVCKRRLCKSRNIVLIEVRYDNFSTVSITQELKIYNIPFVYDDSKEYLCIKYSKYHKNTN